MSNKLLVIIAGSTGVGKTETAIKLARHFNTEILSADSRQIYRELNIGVGKPSPKELKTVKHHFIGHISIHDSYTAAMYAKEASALLDQLFEKHNIVILTGGTGLYIKALTEGFDEIPDVPVQIAKKWQSLWEEKGNDYLLSQLKEKDPVYLQKVDPANHTRLIRALSVIETSHQPFSHFLIGATHVLPYRVLPIVLQLPREELYDKINQRVLHMMESGWLKEAREVFAYRDHQALQTVGYKELFDHFDGKLSLDEAIKAIQQSTRRYAKRQLTWWRNQGQWIEMHPSDLKAMIDIINTARHNPT